MFAGLDDVDWAGMNHAYGPATDVPDLIRGLVSADQAVRERALDAMEGAVHHQFDVYDCTVAAMPFLLEAATTPGLPGRADVLELIASIGGARHAETGSGHPAEAARVLAAAGPVLLELLSDADPAVRRAVGAALPGCRDDLEQVASAVLARLPIEADPDVQVALIETASLLGKPVPEDFEPPFARVRVAVLTANVRSGQLTAETVAALSAAVEAAYVEPLPAERPGPVRTDTLRGMLYQRQPDRGSEDLDCLVRDASWAFGDRIIERRAFLAGQLRAENPAQRYPAVFAVQHLLYGWRGDHGELISLLGDQLSDGPDRLRARAAITLGVVSPIAAPAADALADCVESAPRTGGPMAWLSSDRQVSPAILALAKIGDRRAVPAVRWLLGQDRLPPFLNSFLFGLGAEAAELVPLIRQRLRTLGTSELAKELCSGLAAIGPDAVEAAPEVRAALESADRELAARVLLGIGADAAAASLLRPMLTDPQLRTAVDAAAALWPLDGDTPAALPVLLRGLRGDDFTAAAAARGVREMGPVAETAIPSLRALLAREDEYGWLHQSAALALWRITGDSEPTLAVLESVWAATRRRWPALARDLVQFGPAAAPLAPLLREALASPHRYLVETDLVSEDDLMNAMDIGGDEALQRDSRTVLAAVREG